MTRRVRFLSAEQIIEIHRVLIERWGGTAGGGHRGAGYEGVDAAVQAVKNSYYETREELGAAYAVNMVQGHVFLDGNKRAGAAAMLAFVDSNGVRVRLSADEIAAMMIDLQRRAEAGDDPGALVRWIAANITPRRRA